MVVLMLYYGGIICSSIIVGIVLLLIILKSLNKIKNPNVSFFVLDWPLKLQFDV